MVISMPATAPLEPEDWALWDNWLQAHRALCRELERTLVRDIDISEAEFSLMAALQRAPEGLLRVVEIADALDWDKSRVAHQLTRLEGRGFITREAGGTSRRRTGVRLSDEGRTAVKRAFAEHGANIKRLFLSSMSTEQRKAIADWSTSVLDRGAEKVPGTSPAAPTHQD
jgi:DNA-binding MarR family transcriptional regulator